MIIVYITTNIKNNKQYVGSHTIKKFDDGYIGSGRIFLRAVKKYGKENFNREILYECQNILEARKLEAFNIKKYKTLVPNGYNVNENGGWGYSGIKHSLLTRKKISEAVKGFKHTEEAKKKMSKARKTYLKENPENHPFWNKHHTEESLQKISENRKGITAGSIHHYFGKERDNQTKIKISKTLQGRNLSEEHKQKLSEASKMVKKIKCEYCQKEFAPWTIRRHIKIHNNI